jgi:hypothetical protein
VEIALVLPVLVLALLLVVQVALIGLAQVLVVQAARNAARAAAVDSAPGAARAAAVGTAGLRPERVTVDVGTRGPPGSLVAVTVRYRAPTEVPLVGRLLGEVTLTATVSVQVETATAARRVAAADQRGGTSSRLGANPAARRRERAPALSSGSFQLPHLGDCTHDGHPSSQPHASSTSNVARSWSSAAS